MNISELCNKSAALTLRILRLAGEEPKDSVHQLLHICVWQQSQIEALQRAVVELQRQSVAAASLQERVLDLRLPKCPTDPDASGVPS